MFAGTAQLGGAFKARKIPTPKAPGLWKWKLKQFFKYQWRELPQHLFVMLLPFLRIINPAICCMHGQLYAKVRRADGTWEDYGLIGRHLVVTAGKNFIAGCFDNTNEAETLKYHGFGTGTTAAAIGDTTLVTELTTQYAVNSTRPTGSQVSSSATYTTVGTVTPDASCALTEWGLFSASSSGTLLDRQVFSAINLNGSGDSLATTYVLTIS